MRTLIYFLLDPVTIGIALVILAYGLARWNAKPGRVGWWLAALYGTFLLLTPLPKLLVVDLESRYTPLQTIACAPPTHIVVLASGFTADERLPASGQLNSSSLGRLVEGIRLAQQCPNATLIVSGPDNDEGISQGEVTRQAAISLGVDADRIRLLDDPVNTAAEAAATKALIGTEQPIVLVTSAIHLHRSVYWFAGEGLSITAAPADYRIKQDADYRWYTWDPLQNIGLFDAWLHETIGLLWARMIS